jgi:ABC-2 type transport system permease protein
MSETFIVFRREFVERVRARSFIISTLLVPALMMGIAAATAISARGGGGEKKIVLVDEAPAGVGPRVEAALVRPRKDPDDPTYRVERIAAPFQAHRAELLKRVQRKEIDGYVWLPADVLDGNRVEYRSANISNFNVLSDIRGAVTEGVETARLNRAGLNAADIASLVRPVDVKTSRITDKGEEGGTAAQTFWLGYVIGFVIYYLIIFYGMNVLRSVLEEKTSRVAEVIVSSMKATHLMTGKILGVAAVALLQVAIWVALVAVGVSQSSLLAERYHVSPQTMAAMRVDPLLGLAMVLFLLLGFLLYAGLFAALGAAVNSEQEAQQFQTVVLLPLFATIAFIFKVATDPLGTIATRLGMIPFTSPITMPIRMAGAQVPTAQIVGSLALLVVANVVVAWAAGKIYRVGILSTGKKPTLAELGRWLRAA